MAEKEFPGISRFYRSLETKPSTFLELVWLYCEMMADPSLRQLILAADGDSAATEPTRH